MKKKQLSVTNSADSAGSLAIPWTRTPDCIRVIQGLAIHGGTPVVKCSVLFATVSLVIDTVAFGIALVIVKNKVFGHPYLIANLSRLVGSAVTLVGQASLLLRWRNRNYGIGNTLDAPHGIRR